MAERPMLFSGPMVQALLARRKTQTRRVRKLAVSVGDRLWVKETFKPIPASRPGGYFVEGSPFYGRQFFYRADNNCPLWADGKWKPSIFMPREASRLTLVVTAVREQRLQDISADDAIAEGIDFDPDDYALAEWWAAVKGEPIPAEVSCYALLWNKINGAGAWEANPMVSAYTFTVERAQ